VLTAIYSDKVNILVCYDDFSKHVKLYPIKAATMRACLNKLINSYFGKVIKTKITGTGGGRL